MDIETLRPMDEQADKTIRTWSFAALGANLLPPPFDMIAVGAVFAKMGATLAKIYQVQVSRETLKKMGLTIAQGIAAVVGGYIAFDLLKLVPGVNLWVAILVQPPIVAAIAYAAGHAFKEYYHTSLVEGRELTAHEVGEIAKAALQERLDMLRRVPPPLQPPAVTKPPRFLELPYPERKMILVADKAHKPVNLSSGSQVLVVTRRETKGIGFPLGHPRDKVLYIGHPLVKASYYPAAEFHRETFLDKFWELVDILTALGASHISVLHERGYGNEITVNLNARPGIFLEKAGVQANDTNKSRTSILFEANLPGHMNPTLPERLVWYQYEPNWQRIATLRLERGLRDFSMTLEYRDDFGVNAQLEGSAKKLGLSLGGKFEAYQTTVWQVAGIFAEAGSLS